jgi:cellobiose phosphorylase
MYRLGFEAILGIRRVGKALHIRPLLPTGWDGFTAQYRAGEALYDITVRRAASGDPPARLDGQDLAEPVIALDQAAPAPAGGESLHRIEVFVADTP